MANNLDYVLRISLPKCNLNCIYCRPSPAAKEIKESEYLSENELLDVIKAASMEGIEKVRWTGGEPTMNKNYVKIVNKTRGFGIKEQYLSTNGTTLDKLAEKLYEGGINRINISLDTLNRKKYAEITGFDLLPQVLSAFNKAVNIFDYVKINTVLTRANYEDTGNLISFANKLALDNNVSSDKIALRFIELVPGGFEHDKDYVKANALLGGEVINKAKELFGDISKASFIGDNPMCQYYKINKNGVIFGIIPHYSVNFQCGGKRCKKLRLNPTGMLSNCSIHSEFGHNVKNTSFEEKRGIIKHLIDEKSKRENQDFLNLKHFQSDYSFWRFGKSSKEDA